MTRDEAYKIALAADEAWSAELRKLYGSRAGDVRYTAQGRLGTCAPLYQAFILAVDKFWALTIK